MLKHSNDNASEAILKATVSRQENLINQMTTRSLALEYENSRLRLLLYNSWCNKGNIPPEEIDKYELAPMLLEEVMAMLQKPLERLGFNTRVSLTFRALDILTVKDLLVEIKEFEMYHLRCYRSFGEKSFKNVFEILHKNGIIDKDNNSYLFEFL